MLGLARRVRARFLLTSTSEVRTARIPCYLTGGGPATYRQ